MNRSSESKNHTSDHEMFVTTDFGSIPASEMRPMFNGFGAWLSATVRYKILRAAAQPHYAIELRRMIKAKHVPKRMKPYFDDLQKTLERMNFAPNFFSTFPAAGPYSSATMAMSRADGDLHFFATKVITQVQKQIREDTHIGFVTWMNDGTSVVTISAANLPQASNGVLRASVPSEDPEVVLKKHRERIRNQAIEVVMPDDLFDRMEAENQQQTEDLLNRSVIRPATVAEMKRIRSDVRG